MTLSGCAFQTARLAVADWREGAQRTTGLAETVASVMTERVTATLPEEWQIPGGYTVEDARQWIAARDAEGPTLLVSDLAAGEVLGFLIPFAVDGDRGVDVRLGYVLAEHAWGRGIASELLAGFVSWCRARPDIASLTGGVGKSNPASARVLQKSGFVAVEDEESGEDPGLYRLQL